jgi:site-specific DNA-methyltransferase (adenine-specific)
MTPYYDEDGITIYHGDCRDILPSLRADVLITDPPYGVQLSARRARNKFGGSHEIAPASVLYHDHPDAVRDLIRVAIPLALSVTERALIFPGFRMLWEYPPAAVVGSVHLPAGCGYTPWGFQTSQPILYYGADPFLADGMGNRPNGFRPERAYRSEPIDHPAPKPMEWMTWAVGRASRPGELILDPFAGSGTTLRAARDMGRKAIGIEIEERYCEIAVQRLAQGVLAFDA